MSGDDQDQDLKILKSHVAQLAEHYESVQVFVTRRDRECTGTISCNDGCGNWHARMGQVREWVVKQDRIIQLEAEESFRQDQWEQDE